MDPSDAIQLIVILILIILSAFFSSAETALTTVSRIRIRSLVEENEDKRAIVVNKILEDSSKMLSAILIGNNIVNLSASSLATVFATRHFGSYAAGISTGVLTFVLLIFGEIAPKTAATTKSESMSLKYGKIVYWTMIIFTPLIFITNKIASAFLKLIGTDPDAADAVMTESELRTIVDVSHEEGVIEQEERELINNVFDFGDSIIKEIMVPRADVTFVHIDSTYEELMKIYQEDRYTRYPVYDESTDNVIGILNMKDLILQKDFSNFSIRNIMRTANYTYEQKKTSELLIEMRVNSFSIAIILDEYGITAGIITLEDMLEELVGEIRDEFDENEMDVIRKINDYEYLVEGSLKLDDLNDELGLNLESEAYDSIGGFIIELLEDLPVEGDRVTTESNVILVVDKMDTKRIETVHLFLPKPEEEDVES